MIEFIDLHKRFGDKPVLAGIDLTIPPGQVQFVIGTSGAGKSVLMKHVVGLVRADRGTVRFDGEDVTQLVEAQFRRVRARCALVFQHSTLFDALTMLDNVALPIEKRYRVSMSEARARASVALEARGLGAWMRKMPAEVGAGVKKRVAIARALALEPACVIYDEPTTGLDPVAARQVDALILELKGRGLTQVVVSHDLRSILGVADDIALLHLGRVHARGSREALLASVDPVVRQFLRGEAVGPL